jgi:hypothetical protein
LGQDAMPCLQCGDLEVLEVRGLPTAWKAVWPAM